MHVLAERTDEYTSEAARHLERAGVRVSFRDSGGTPDADFCVMSLAPTLVASSGGFSKLATGVNANTKLVFVNRTGSGAHWLWTNETFPGSCSPYFAP